MKLIALLALASLALSGPVVAQSLDPLTYLQECTTGSEAPEGACEYARAQFIAELPQAYRADYQAVRNVSFCLATGCDGAVRVDPRESCAWRTIAYGLAPTGDEKILEQMSMRTYCTTVAESDVRAFLDAILMRVKEIED